MKRKIHAWSPRRRKIPAPEMAQDSSSSSDFSARPAPLPALNHPNICTIHAIEQHDRQHFLVMELLEGQDARPTDAPPILFHGKIDSHGHSDCRCPGIRPLEGNRSPGHQACKSFRHRPGARSKCWTSASQKLSVRKFPRQVPLHRRWTPLPGWTRACTRNSPPRARPWARFLICRRSRPAANLSTRARIYFHLVRFYTSLLQACSLSRGETSAVVF